MADLTCPSCQAKSPDGLLCAKCIGRCRRALRTIRDLWPEMTSPTVSRWLDGGSASSDRTPLPVNMTAADDSDEVRSRLVGIVRMLDMGDTQGMADWPPVWCVWLDKRAVRISTHAAVLDIVAEIETCMRLVLRHAGGRGDQVYCGACEVCGHGLYSRPGRETITCRRCVRAGLEPVEVQVQQRRDAMMVELEDVRATRDEVLGALPKVYGVRIERATLRQWIHRGRLSEVGGRIRVGDVLDLAHGESRRRA